MNYDKIILISVDTLRADCYKGSNNCNCDYLKLYDINTILEKSMFDELINNGFFFNNAISVAPYTAASHAAYFSGKWQINNGVYDHFNSKLKSSTVFESFKDAGYVTNFKTDFTFILGKYLGFLNGVDNYFIEDNDKAIESIFSQKKTFNFIHFGQVHYPYGFHNLKFGGKDYEMFVEQKEAELNLSISGLDINDNLTETFRDKKDMELLVRYKNIIQYLYSNGRDKDIFSLYLDGVNRFKKKIFDPFMTQLLDRLKNETYLIVLFSDHGEEWSESCYGHINSLSEGCIKVPMVFYGTDIGRDFCSSRIRTIDLAPTLYDLAKINHPKLDGKSLLKIMKDKQCRIDRDAFSSIWLNPLPDLQKNIMDVLETDRIQEGNSASTKYAYAVYKDNLRFESSLNRYKNRTFELEKNLDKNYFEKKEKNWIKFDGNTADFAPLIEMGDELNSIKTVNSNLATDTLRKYFKLQGYNI